MKANLDVVCRAGGGGDGGAEHYQWNHQILVGVRVLFDYNTYCTSGSVDFRLKIIFRRLFWVRFAFMRFGKQDGRYRGDLRLSSLFFWYVTSK